MPAPSVRIALLTLVLATALAGPAAAKPYPETIPLPDGWQPEGIAHVGDTFFSGSRANGGIYRGNLRTGQGAVLVPGRPGGMATGMKVDHRGRLFVSGAATGTASVYNAASGALLRTYTLATDPSFINDVTLTRRAAYFTDSVNQRLYVLKLRRHGGLPAQASTLPLTGDVHYVAGEFNLNGIDTVNRHRLIAVQSVNGKLFTINARSGRTHEIDLGGGDVTNGDGILLKRRTLFVVQNVNDEIAVVHLSKRLRRGVIKRHLTDSDLDVPTTIVRRGRFLFAVNARFTTPATPTTKYDVVRVTSPKAGASATAWQAKP